MDANKAQRLRDIGYEIGPTCGTCKHGLFAAEDDFGTCRVNEYVHLKHTGSPRKLSIFQHGRCPKFERASWVEEQVHGFKEFLK
ncbi:MAG: hypothetical protein JO112_20145 [Planctomycetes bacterium]|nr:hypothetical protein [Planctomycetota bacterium]